MSTRGNKRPRESVPEDENLKKLCKKELVIDSMATIAVHNLQVLPGIDLVELLMSEFMLNININ